MPATDVQPTKTKLSQEERIALQSLAGNPGYAALLRLMEMACILQDSAVMSVPVEEERKIIAEQRVAVAKWAFFSEVRKQVEFEIGELEPDGNNGAPTPQGGEEPIENILSAFPASSDL